MKIEHYKTKGLCKKQQVLAIAKVAGKTYVGENWVKKPQEVCPRIGMKTGEGYEVCYSVCGQVSHAEIDLIEQVGGDLKGNDVYLFGHTYACDNCKDALRKANSGKILVEGK